MIILSSNGINHFKNLWNISRYLYQLSYEYRAIKHDQIKAFLGMSTAKYQEAVPL